MCLGFFHCHHWVQGIGAGLFLSPSRKCPECEERPKAPSPHALLMQREGWRAARGKHNIHATGKVSQMPCKRRYGYTVLFARKRFVKVLQVCLYMSQDVATLHNIFVYLGEAFLDTLNVLRTEAMLLYHFVPEGAPGSKVLCDVAPSVKQVQGKWFDLLSRD